jgi:hypothetical protein
MIGAILSRAICAQCKVCCRYTDDDVWDAPGFTQTELTRVLEFINDAVYNNSRGLFFLHMPKDGNGEYTCPLLRDTGCLLGDNKPFKCAIWPLYVVNYNENLALVVSSECPSVYQLQNQDIINQLGETISHIYKIVLRFPELIEPFRPQFRIICLLGTLSTRP